jgi:hypothetical protein
MKYKSKPAEIEASQWHDSNTYIKGVNYDAETKRYYVITVHNQRCYIEPGDFIATEPDGIHHYPVKPDIFNKRWERVE